MPLPTKPTRPPHEIGRDSEESSTPSNNLWVGNLSPDVTDSDLMNLFAQYGALDSVTSYSARSYAFVFFKRVEDAKAAKNALQAFSFRGNSLKIEFARPVRSHLFFTFSSDSCINIIYFLLINYIIILASLQQCDFGFNLPTKLLRMHSHCSNQIPSFCGFSYFA